MYRHTQVGRVTLLALATTTALLLGPLAFVREPAVIAILVTVGAVLVLCAVFFSTLTVSIDARELSLRFGPGPIRRRIALASIRGARPVRNPWWYGWGIHWTPDGWLWNVAGLDAVELELADGRRFRVGTDEPLVLAERLEAARHAAG